MTAATHTTHATSLKERQRQERERLILRAAADLVLEKGYHDTAIDDIAARVGISKGTVYLHFASKEELVLALIERGMREFRDALDAILSGPGTRQEKLRAIIRHICGSMAGQRYQLFSVLTQEPELFSRFTERREAKAKPLDESRARIGALLDEGKAAGEFDATLPTSVVLSVLGSLMTVQTYHRLVVREQMPLDDLADDLSRFFFKGIAPGKVTDTTTDDK